MSTTYALLADLYKLRGMPAADGDGLLQLYLDTAADRIDSYCNTQFTTGTATSEEYSGDGGRVIWLAHRPAIAITTVVVDDSTLGSTEYELEDYRRLVIPEGDYNPRLRNSSGCWPLGTNNIEITYTYGYAAIPNAVKLATMKLAAHYYRRDGSGGVSAESMGPRSVSYTGDEMPMDIAGLLSRYIEHGVKG